MLLAEEEERARKTGIQDPVGLGWLGVLQGAGAAAQRAAPGTGRREEALIHFWKTEPNRRIKSASRFRVLGLCGTPGWCLSSGTFVSLDRLGAGCEARDRRLEKARREARRSTPRRCHQGRPLFCLSRLCASGTRFPVAGSTLPSPRARSTADFGFFPCHSFLTSSPVRHTASPRVFCCSSLAVGAPLR